MNNQSSPGFLYFQTTPQKEPQNTPNLLPDFIAFNDQRDNSNQQEFSPRHFSSPQTCGRGRRGNFRQDRKQKQSPLWSGSPRQGGFRSFNSSHNSSYNSNSQHSLQNTPNLLPNCIAFNGQGDNSNQQEFSPGHFSSPQTSSRGRGGNFRQDRRRKQSPLRSRSPRQGGFRSFNSSHNSSYNSNSQNSLQETSDLDGSRFLHSSFTEDPWKKLESQLEQNKSSKSSLVQN